MVMRYYSTQRPVMPGSYPKKGAQEVRNYDDKTYIEEIDGEAWGYIEYDRELTAKEERDYELTPSGGRWFSVTVASKKRGGGVKAVVDTNSVRAAQRPQDERFDTRSREFKRRYFKSLKEAERVRDVLNAIEVTVERVRSSATQGECRVYINGEYIINFGDDIVIVPKGSDPEELYGDDIGGWKSSKPDSSFALGLIWHPFDSIYHYSDMVCKKLGIEPGEWIGGQDNE